MTETWADWLTRNVRAPAFEPVRERVLDLAHVHADTVVLDLGAGTGLLSRGAFARGARVIALDPDPACLAELRRQGVSAVPGRAEQIPLVDDSVDAVVCRSVLIHVESLDTVARELLRVLRNGGWFAAFEPLNRRSTYLHDAVDWTPTGIDVAADDGAWLEQEDPLSRLDERELEHALAAAGFADVELELEAEDELWLVDGDSVDARLDVVGAPGQPSRRERWTARYGAETTARLVAHLKSHAGQALPLRWLSVYVAARKP